MPSARRRQRSQILELLERYEPLLAAAFRESIDDLRGNVDMAALERALAAGDTEGAIRALRIDRAAFLALETQIQASYSASGGAMAGSISNLRNPTTGERLFVRFDLRNPQAERWVAEHSSRMIVEIVEDQRAAARLAIEAGVSRGDGPRRTALDIVGRINRATGRREGGILGLTAKQTEWAQAARNELASGDPTLLRRYLDRQRRDKRFDRSVLKAIREGTPVPQSIVDRAAQSYTNSLLKLRGDTIGRTEALSAMNAARDQAVRQASANGTKKTWSATGDDRTRDAHAEMDGQTVGLDEPFTTPDGYKLMYPGDTSLGAPAEHTIGCRCWVEYEIDFLAGVT